MNKKSRHKTEVIKQIIGKGILPITLGQQILGVLEKIDYFLVKYKLLKFIKNNKKWAYIDSYRNYYKVFRYLLTLESRQQTVSNNRKKPDN